MMPVLTEIWQQGQDALAALAAVIIALEVLVRVLRVLVAGLSKCADMTATKIDDDFFASLSGTLGSAATALEWLEKRIPRAALGKNVKRKPVATAVL